MAALTLEVLKEEYDTVNDAVFTVIAHGVNTNDQQAATILQHFQELVTSRPLSSDSLPHIMEGWVGIDALENSECVTSLEIRKQRFTIMTINYVAWYWLDVFVVDHCKTILGGTLDSNAEWLVRLVLDVKEHHEHRCHTPRTFRPLT